MDPKKAAVVVGARRQEIIKDYSAKAIAEIDALQLNAIGFPLRVTFAHLQQSLSIPPDRLEIIEFALYQVVADHYDKEGWLVVREEEKAFVFELKK